MYLLCSLFDVQGLVVSGTNIGSVLGALVAGSKCNLVESCVCHLYLAYNNRLV